MTDLRKLPTSTEEMRKIHPEFPRLRNDSPKGCPRSMGDIRRYIAAETGEKGQDLFFGRTALVSDVKFWLWSYADKKGRTQYVDVSYRKGTSTLSMGSGEGLTPEQYIALQYARDWRGGGKQWAAQLKKEVDAAMTGSAPHPITQGVRQPSTKQVRSVPSELPRLKDDSSEGCPFSMSKIRRYVRVETAWKGRDLFFERTARVDDVRFWPWRYVDNSGVTCYILVAGTDDGEMEWLMRPKSGDGLTPEQYIAREYARNWLGAK